MRCNMNPFQQKLYDEFEDNCFKLLGVGSDRVREVLGEKGQDIDKLFTEAWDYGGAPFMRQTMSMSLATLELVYYETAIGRELTEEEQAERYSAWDIGLNAEIMENWTAWRIQQLDDAGFYGSEIAS